MSHGDMDKELRQVAESLVLADRMFRKGRISEAEPMYERSLAMLIRTYAEAHPDVDACLMRLGDIYFAREKFAQALSTYSRLHGLRCRTLSIHHADTVAVLFKVAKSQERLERFDEAAKTYEEAISIGEQWLQPGLPLIGSMMEGYAILLRKYLNQPQRAVEIEHRAKEYRKRYTGSKGTLSGLASLQSLQSLPFAPADSGVAMSPVEPVLRFTQPEPVADLPKSMHIRDESLLRTEFDNRSPAPAPAPAPAPTPTLSPAPTPTLSPAPTPTLSPAPTPTPTPSPGPNPTPNPNPNPSPSPRPTPSPGPGPGPSASPSASANPALSSDARRTDHTGENDDEEDDDDEYYDDEDYDEKPAPKNFLLIAFVVMVALIVPTFVGWIVMTRHPKIELTQPVSRPTSFGATTLPVTTGPSDFNVRSQGAASPNESGSTQVDTSTVGGASRAEVSPSRDFAPVEKRAEPITP